MKKIAILTLAMVLSYGAHAGIYFGIGYGTGNYGLKTGGVKDNPNKEDNPFNILLGYSLDLMVIPAVKIEFEYINAAFEKTGVGAYDAKADTFMLNAYLHIPQPIPFISPYISGGFGTTTLDLGSSKSSRAIGGAFGIEGKIPMVPVRPAVEIKYIKADDFDFGTGKTEYTNTMIYGKLSFYF